MSDNCFTIDEHHAVKIGVGEEHTERKLLVKSATAHLEHQHKKKFVNGWVDKQKGDNLIDGYVKGKFQDIEVIGLYGSSRTYPISHIAIIDENDDSSLYHIAICWS